MKLQIFLLALLCQLFNMDTFGQSPRFMTITANGTVGVATDMATNAVAGVMNMEILFHNIMDYS